MGRSTRAEMARETVAIIERGSYRAASGQEVEIGAAVRACLEATEHVLPDELERLRGEVLAQPGGDRPARIEVVGETTLEGIARLVASGGGPVAALNFASAKNPGGGFHNGSQAQEESLARSSALYASLGRARSFYDGHRAMPSLLYSDAMILSPGCPIFRDDAGNLLEEPRVAAFVTAAPNAGAIANNRPGERAAIPATLARRSELVLALAATRGYRRLVLGAWGCGVFRNDPGMVADAFAAHLVGGPWSNRFDRVSFSVLDTSADRATLRAFERAFAPAP